MVFVLIQLLHPKGCVAGYSGGTIGWRFLMFKEVLGKCNIPGHCWRLNPVITGLTCECTPVCPDVDVNAIFLEIG